MTENTKNIATKNMEGLGDNEFLLPVGYKDSDGVIHKVVTLAPMTGETEEAISDPKVRENGGKIVTALLSSVVTKVGNLPRVTKEVIMDMTTFDRDFLILKNRQVSLGDEINFTDNCPHCKAKNEIHINLQDIETKYLEDDNREMTFELPNGYLDAKGVVHKEITITIPTGRLQERIAPLARTNPAQATTLLLQLITLKLGTLEFINPDVFKRMTKRDRDFISTKLSELEVGVKFDTDAICSECGSEFATSIPLQSLLGE